MHGPLVRLREQLFNELTASLPHGLLELSLVVGAILHMVDGILTATLLILLLHAFPRVYLTNVRVSFIALVTIIIVRRVCLAVQFTRAFIFGYAELARRRFVFHFFHFWCFVSI